MEYIFKNIHTEIGTISSGRDAVYLDDFIQKNNQIMMKGEINSRFCLKEFQTSKWYQYEIICDDVKAYCSEHIDIYPWKKWRTNSAFSEVENSDWQEEYKLNKKEYVHLVIETYDYIYYILCRKYDIHITGKR